MRGFGWTTTLAITMAAVLTGAACAASSSSQRDGATILNSGSTNASGYRIEVWSDNTGSVALADRLGVAQSTPKPFALATGVARQFLADLRAARDGNARGVPCMKSASFGTTTRVKWHGWTSPDLSCPPGDALTAALKHDVDAIVTASGIASSLYRRRGFPGVLRRVPIEAASPSASPSSPPHSHRRSKR